jgi:hypothetical protein
MAIACKHVFDKDITTKQYRLATVELLRREGDLDQREQHVLNLLTGFYRGQVDIYLDCGDGTKLGWLREETFKAALPNESRSFF